MARLAGAAAGEQAGGVSGLTKELLRAEPRANLLRVASELKFAEGFEQWSDRRLVKRCWRQLRPDRKQVVKLRHLQLARRCNLERLARFEGIAGVEQMLDAELVAALWPLVDARQR